MDLATFFEHFDTLAEAPNGIQRLRELILDMAVRGKLVPQDPEDEPAKELLRKITDEKKLLIKNKVLRKSNFMGKPLDYEPFILPAPWTWSRLDDTALIITDGEHATPPRTSQETIPLGTAKNIRDGFIDLNKTDYVLPEVAEKCWKRCRPRHNDLLMVCVGATTGRLCLIKNPPDFVIVRSVALIRPFPKFIFPEYLELAIRTPCLQDQIWNSVKRSAQPCLYINRMQQLVIPLPPLAEQKRIVAKVDELMGLCDALEAAQQTRNTLRQSLRASALDALMTAPSDDELSTAWAFVRDNWDTMSDRPEDVEGLRQMIFQKAIEGKLSEPHADDDDAERIVESSLQTKHDLESSKKIVKRKRQLPLEEGEIGFVLPKKWSCARFGDIADIVSGVTKGRKLVGRKTDFFPYLRVANVQRWSLDLRIIKEIELPVEELDRYRLFDGDILLTEGGDWDKLGRSTIWRGEIQNCIHQNHVFRARLFDSKIIAEWVTLFTNSFVGRSYFEKAAKRTTNLASINMTQLRFCPMPIPPFAEQKRIVAKVEELMQLCDQLETHLRQQQTQAQAFAAAAVSALAA
jgi:type I restriction enzyme S subunit